MPSTGERVLIVESDPAISDLIARQVLKPLGYEVRVLTEASQAIQESLEGPPDLIIANLDLPDLGGKDVLAAISSRGVNAPLVVICEKGQERRAIQALRLGAADAILWPSREAEIVRVVERALQPTRSRRIRRQLYQQLEVVQEELNRRALELSAITTLVKAVRARSDQRQLLGRLLEGGLVLGRADIAWFTVRESAGPGYVLRAQRNLPVAWARKLNQPLDDGLSSLVRRSGQALAIHGQPLAKFTAGALGRAAVVLPVKVGDEVIAVLLVIRKADVEFEKDTQALLQLVADLASISLLNSQLFRALDSSSAASRLGERRRKELLEGLRSSVDRLEALGSDGAGELTQAQEKAFAEIRTSLDRFARSSSGEAPLPPARKN